MAQVFRWSLRQLAISDDPYLEIDVAEAVRIWKPHPARAGVPLLSSDVEHLTWA